MKDYWYVFGINRKGRLIPILQYQNHENQRLYIKKKKQNKTKQGGGGNHPSSVDMQQKWLR